MSYTIKLPILTVFIMAHLVLLPFAYAGQTCSEVFGLKKVKRIAIINGPNLNMLGIREPEVYGKQTLSEIMNHTEAMLKNMSVSSELDWFQSNSEGAIIDRIHEIVNDNNYLGLVINPAGYTHTSVAIHDALKILSIPIIEVHLTNTSDRESFRATKITSKAATSVLEGLGGHAYFIGALTLILKQD